MEDYLIKEKNREKCEQKTSKFALNSLLKKEKRIMQLEVSLGSEFYLKNIEIILFVAKLSIKNQ